MSEMSEIAIVALAIMKGYRDAIIFVAATGVIVLIAILALVLR